MKFGAHDIVSVSGQQRESFAGLPAPNSSRLIIWSSDDPRVLWVKIYAANVLGLFSEHANFNLFFIIENHSSIVIACCEENRQSRMKFYTAANIIMDFEFFMENFGRVVKNAGLG